MILDTLTTAATAITQATTEARALLDANAQLTLDKQHLTSDLAAAQSQVASLTAQLATCQGTVPVPPDPPATTNFRQGGYMGHGAGQLDDSAAWFAGITKTDPRVVMTYSGPPSGWFFSLDELDAAQQWLAGHPDRLVVYSIHPNDLTRVSPTPWDDASLDYKHVWLAKEIAKRGFASQCIIRLGWEMNGVWNPRWAWQPLSLSAADLQSGSDGYKRMFRRIAPLYKANAPGVRINWCPNSWEDASAPRNPARFYPGDDVVDVVGFDQYDVWLGTSMDPNTRWASLAKILQRHSDFADLHHKPKSIDEWGIFSASGAPGYGGGDNPVYITNSAKWYKDKGFLYSVYFNSADGGVGIDLSTAPKSAAAYDVAFSNFGSGT